MIDLKKLEAKFDALFESENEESFDKWLQEKRMSEIISSLGEGEFININVTGQPYLLNANKHTTTNMFLDNCNNNNVGNTQYAMAA